MVLLAVFTPLIAFVTAFLFGKQLGHKGAQFVTCTGIIIAAFFSILLFIGVTRGGEFDIHNLGSWMAVGDFSINWALRIDTLSVIMMCVINIVSACVHIYSLGYMSHDDARGRFMSYLSLFTFAMLMLVSADNLVQLFFGWEGVGLASYLLIGFWNTKDSANTAAQKAFVTNRVGDFGLALGIFAIFVLFGSVTFSDIFSQTESFANSYFNIFGYDLHALTTIGLLLFIGAMGKSAQLGLHVWLPDAMEGPTPVSALIHAATMVTAGIFLVARFSPLYEYAPDALMVVTLVGGTTAIVAATIGLTQFDIKRVIAYSTMSQLGYMFFALGVSAYGAAMFHLVTHAFFKALLFLGAGSVIHAMSNEQDMRKMGGIYKKIPYTYALMWIGSLALAGIPPFAGFYSKDIVLEAAWADHTWFGDYAFWMGIAAAFLTAFYSWRLLLMTFHGKPRATKEVMSHIHESPKSMMTPLVILAIGAIFSGMIFYTPFVGGGHHDETHKEHADDAHNNKKHHEEEIAQKAGAHNNETHKDDHHQSAWSREGFWRTTIFVKTENDTVEAAHNVPLWVKLLPLLMGVGGILSAYMFYLWVPKLPARMMNAFPTVHKLFFGKWFFDEIYQAIFIRKCKRIGAIFSRSDKHVIDAMGADGSAKLSSKLANGLSKVQSGFIYHYAFMMMMGVVLLLTWFAYKIFVEQGAG